jgi:predicted solute-binding protein
MGRWFKSTYGLPLPLGGNVLLRSLGQKCRASAAA